MASYERWEERQRDAGRSPRQPRPPRARRPAGQPTPVPRPMSVNVTLPQRTFREWIVAGFGIGIGLILLYLAIGITVLIVTAVCTSVVLPKPW